MHLITARPFSCSKLNPRVNCTAESENGVSECSQDGRTNIIDHLSIISSSVSYRKYQFWIVFLWKLPFWQSYREVNSYIHRTLKPVGHQSTNWIVRFVLIWAMAALTSLGTTSPRYSMQQAMYLPRLGSHLTIWLAGSKHAFVISMTDSCSW